MVAFNSLSARTRWPTKPQKKQTLRVGAAGLWACFLCVCVCVSCQRDNFIEKSSLVLWSHELTITQLRAHSFSCATFYRCLNQSTLKQWTVTSSSTSTSIALTANGMAWQADAADDDDAVVMFFFLVCFSSIAIHFSASGMRYNEHALELNIAFNTHVAPEGPKTHQTGYGQ